MCVSAVVVVHKVVSHVVVDEGTIILSAAKDDLLKIIMKVKIIRNNLSFMEE